MLSCGAAAVSTTKGRSHDTKGTAAGYGKAPLVANAVAAARLIAGLTDGLGVRAGGMGVLPLSDTCAAGGGTKVGA